MENQLAAARCRINVFGHAFKANAPLRKIAHRGNQIREGAAQAV
jgi:hypothetical protein